MHYHFVAKEEVKRGVENGEFVEYAEVHGNYYGTRLVTVCFTWMWLGRIRFSAGNGPRSKVFRTLDCFQKQSFHRFFLICYYNSYDS